MLFQKNLHNLLQVEISGPDDDFTRYCIFELSNWPEHDINNINSNSRELQHLRIFAERLPIYDGKVFALGKGIFYNKKNDVILFSFYGDTSLYRHYDIYMAITNVFYSQPSTMKVIVDHTKLISRKPRSLLRHLCKKDESLPIVERYAPFEGGSMEAEIRLAYDFSLAQHMIDEVEPDLIIFAKNPESGLEYCLYALAKHFGIKTILTRKGAFHHARVATTDMYGPILGTDWKPPEHIIPIRNLQKPGEELSKVTAQKISEIQNTLENIIPDDMAVQGVVADKDRTRIQFDPKYKYVNLLKGFLSKRGVGDYFKKKLLRYSEKIAIPVEKIDWSKKSFFFPLHYQPELASMPLGGEYVNQLKIIKLFSDLLGQDEQLIVKEHPSTFVSAKKTNANFRTSSFYEWIAKMPRVRLAWISTLVF
jgi:hypothetical protein